MKKLTVLLILICFFGCKQEKQFNSEGKEEEIEQKEKLASQKHDLIEVFEPLPNSEISSPLQLTGKAKGMWFFEANAGVELYNSKNEKIAESYIQATENWMTEDFVPFKGEIEFNASEGKEGYLIIRKANPSGLPEHDDQIKIPIHFQ